MPATEIKMLVVGSKCPSLQKEGWGECGERSKKAFSKSVEKVSSVSWTDEVEDYSKTKFVHLYINFAN